MKSTLGERNAALSVIAALTLWVGISVVARFLVRDWRLHRILWGVSHPWYWLTLNQNSAAAQALAAVVFGVVSVLLGIYSLNYLQEATKAATAQASAANAGVEYARAQTDATRIGMRPVLIPTLNMMGSGYTQLVLRNRGKSVATQITWAICQVTDSSGPMNMFIRPSEHGLAVVEKRRLSGVLVENGTDTDTLTLDVSGLYLMLINCIDLNNNICQTQCQFSRVNDETVDILGFAQFSIEERRIFESALHNPHDPEACGITAW